MLCSNPPVHGARIVAEVVGDEATFNEWRSEMDGMAGRIKVQYHDITRLLSASQGTGLGHI